MPEGDWVVRIYKEGSLKENDTWIIYNRTEKHALREASADVHKLNMEVDWTLTLIE